MNAIHVFIFGAYGVTQSPEVGSQTHTVFTLSLGNLWYVCRLPSGKRVDMAAESRLAAMAARQDHPAADLR